MYHTDIETLKARKPHRCMSCGEQIAAGETYKRWRTYDDGDAGTNKMHTECLAMHQAEAKRFSESQWEYEPYGHERPQPDDEPCTCHPDDNPPQSCAKQYALSECMCLTTAARTLTPNVRAKAGTTAALKQDTDTRPDAVGPRP